MAATATQEEACRLYHAVQGGRKKEATTTATKLSINANIYPGTAYCVFTSP